MGLYNRPPSTYQKTLSKTNGLCFKCQRSVIDGTTRCEIHHVLPRNFGGKNNLSNLIPLCRECHVDITSNMARFLANPQNCNQDIKTKIKEYVNELLIELPNNLNCYIYFES